MSALSFVENVDVYLASPLVKTLRKLVLQELDWSVEQETLPTCLLLLLLNSDSAGTWVGSYMVFNSKIQAISHIFLGSIPRSRTGP